MGIELRNTTLGRFPDTNIRYSISNSIFKLFGLLIWDAFKAEGFPIASWHFHRRPEQTVMRSQAFYN